MTIRAWLRLADCWRCSASISLSEHQVLAVEELTALHPEAAQLQPELEPPTQTPPPAPPEFPQRPSIRPHGAPGKSRSPQSTATMEPIAPRRPAFAVKQSDDSSSSEALPPPPPAPIINEAHDRELERLSRGSFVTRLLRGKR